MSEIFKTEFRGYNKEEVANYITALNVKLEQMKAELGAKETELRRLRDSAMTEEEKDALVFSVRTETEAELRESIEKEIGERLAASAPEPAPAPDPELEELREKARLYDEQKDMIAELMLKARTDAAEVYAESEKRCAAVIADASDKLMRFRDDFEAMKRNVELNKSEMDTRLNNVRHYLDDFTQYLELTTGTINNTVDNFNND